MHFGALAGGFLLGTLPTDKLLGSLSGIHTDADPGKTDGQLLPVSTAYPIRSLLTIFGCQTSHKPTSPQRTADFSPIIIG